MRTEGVKFRLIDEGLYAPKRIPILSIEQMGLLGVIQLKS